MASQSPQTKLLVFTDLDGTLLDHDSYSWQPALPALQRLRELGVPLILNSSKTVAEIATLREQLHNDHPYVIENGSTIVVPAGCFAPEAAATLERFGADYAGIRLALEQLRAEQGYRFAGFADLGVAGVMAATGLAEPEAVAACQRQSSEPLLWLGSAAELNQFRADLAANGLQLVKGGRFHHVMGPGDKGMALTWLAKRYRQSCPGVDFITVALGDGANDLPMLQVANIAVVIPPQRGEALQLPNHLHALYPEQPGPAGWQWAIDRILNTAVL